MSKLAKALTAAAGNAGAGALYVEDVFSTYLYNGTGSNITIDNGIDLDGEGGMVWFKTRSTANGHNIYDTERGNGKLLYITTEPQYTNTTTPWSATSTGFNTGRDFGGSESQSGATTVAWTFRKAEKFFDIVTYTGNGVSGGREISHNLGSSPGFILIKRTDTQTAYSSWMSYHRAGSATGTVAFLNTTNFFFANSGSWFGDGSSAVAPTDTVFTINGGSSNYLNTSGATYIVYLFAHDAGGFGDDGSESIIKCGSYNGNGGSSTIDVNLGFEPQYVFIMNITYGTYNLIYDSMRGIVTGGNDAMLNVNSSYAENGTFGATDIIEVNATGFTITAAGYDVSNRSGSTYIYIAIRRPMKTPESGTEVFAVDDRAAATPAFVSDFPVDLYWTRAKTGGNFFDYARLRGDKYLQHDGTNAETSGAAYFDSNTGVGSSGSASTDNLAWMFKRATGFMDVVCYTGTGSARTIAHNLGVAPSMVVIKRRNGSGYSWPTWHSGYSLYSTPSNYYNSYMELNRDSAVANDATLWNSTMPTESVFSVGSSSETNQNNGTYVAYLFGEVAGVSKFGSYTGTGSNIDIDCGFSAGARFILIKRLSPGAGDWFVFDTFRGIVAGNDPYLYLNTGTAENTGDYIDPLASGFTITSSATWINISTYKYIFWAIA